MEKILKYFYDHKQKVLMYLFAFLFFMVAFILSFFTLAYANDEELILSGIDLYFGSHFNFFVLMSRILILLSLIVLPFSYFYKKIGFLPMIFGLVAIFIFAFLPSIINAPLHNNAEETLFTNVSYSEILIIMISILCMGEILTIAINNETLSFNVREISELAMLVAFAVVLNFVKIPLQWSGSVNLQIVPLVIIALRYSFSKTFISCGIVFGLITCFTDGYGLFAFPLEYLIAFGSVAIISPFRKWIIKDPKDMKSLDYVKSISLLFVLLSIQTTIRFICASIDSYVFYFTYLDSSTSGGNMINAALLYNAPYVYLTGVATIVVIGLLYYPLLRINKIFPPYKNQTIQ